MIQGIRNCVGAHPVDQVADILVDRQVAPSRTEVRLEPRSDSCQTCEQRALKSQLGMPSHTERRRTRMGQNELSQGKLCPQCLGECRYPRLARAGLSAHELHLLVIDVDAV